MPRYHDTDRLIEMIQAKADTLIEGKEAFLYVAKWLELLPPADVVPKSEVSDLEYKLLGVMHSVDKWLDGDELEQDEVNRAITMREKTLRLLENAKTEAAREIFEEINVTWSERNCVSEFFENIAELKKKYTEGKDNE